jgi:hypothetical protein
MIRQREDERDVVGFCCVSFRFVGNVREFCSDTVLFAGVKFVEPSGPEGPQVE